ncbi:MAG: carbon-nitrogen hydrolase family protein [Sulfolobaceae archaeon]
MKIGIVQPASIESGVRLTELALRDNANLVLLPEKWVRTIDQVPLSEFQKLAKKYTAVIIPGAFEDGVSVVSPIINGDGKIVGIAKKIHLFEREKERLIAGDKLVVFSYRGIKFGIVICYDMDFPEIPRFMFLKGVEIILVPSKVDIEGIRMWRDYLRARVLENRIAIVNANAIDPPEFPGMSIALQPIKFGKYVDVKIISELGTNEGYVVVDIDPLSYLHLRSERIREYREFEIHELGNI